jgi:hypothetical protein
MNFEEFTLVSSRLPIKQKRRRGLVISPALACV